MRETLGKLINILSLEAQTGYQNKAVIGGLEKFARYWKEEALGNTSDASTSERIEQIANGLIAYPTCETQDQRETIVSGLLEQLKELQEAHKPEIEQVVRVPAPAKPGSARPGARESGDAPRREPAPEPGPSDAGAEARPPDDRASEEPAARPAAPPLEKPRPQSATPPTEEEPVGESRTSPEAPLPPLQKPHGETAPQPPLEKPQGEPAAQTPLDRAQARPAAPTEPTSPDPNEKRATPAPPPVRYGLSAGVTVLPSVGTAQTRRLSKLGIQTIEDLLFYFPRRYDDYSRLKTIRELTPGEDVTIIVNIQRVNVRHLGGKRSLLKCVVSDGTGQLEITWFNQPYLEKQLQPERQIVLSGRVDQYLGRPTMNAPEWEPLDKDQVKDQVHTGRLVPVYPLTEGMSNRWLRRLLKQTLDHWAVRLADYLPTDVRERQQMLELGAALQGVHFPADEEELAAARRRLIFDEFLLLQLGVLQQRQAWRQQKGRAIEIDRAALDRFIERLPYALTEAQTRAVAEILGDLATPIPMNRLLQGDVGSGKTVVAAAAALAAIHAGQQVALMAPTEILAEQHYTSICRLLEAVAVAGPMGARPAAVRLLTGSSSAAERVSVLDELAGGAADVIIGTHALIQEGVEFASLALAIIDEQHRFGVAQRNALRQKGYNPHILVMTATPIPRTLSLTLYGDLDVSIIDELPPGRQPIKTYIVTNRERERAYRFVQRQIEEGHQAFIICPLVEESEKLDAKAVTAEHKRLQSEVFPTLRLGLLHGRMKSEEKEGAMRQFVAGDLDILVSTSVVEVGIDVPNATVMLIEDAERFGLSQLHQFRGRVGRGSAESYCLLLTSNASDEGWERLSAAAESSDGFALAEKDLQMRGPGDFFGTRQSGLPNLRLARLADVRILEVAREEAAGLLAADPELAQPAHEPLRERVAETWLQVRSDPS